MFGVFRIMRKKQNKKKTDYLVVSTEPLVTASLQKNVLKQLQKNIDYPYMFRVVEKQKK